MAMRGWLRIPEGGIKIDGVSWPAGSRELTDDGWFRLLKGKGAVEITEAEFIDETSAAKFAAIAGPGHGRPLRRGSAKSETKPTPPVKPVAKAATKKTAKPKAKAKAVAGADGDAWLSSAK